MNRVVVTTLVVLLAGVVIWLALRPSAAPQQMPELTGFAPEQVRSLTVVQPDMPSLVFSYAEGRWTLVPDGGEAVVADRDAVAHLIRDLASMRALRVVTRNPEQYAKLKLGAEAIRLSLKGEQGDLLLELLVGKQGSDLLSTYVRIADAAEVLAVDRSLLWQLRRPVEGWREKVEAAAPVAGKAHE